MKIRIKFRKYGPVRFIGHLDVMRFFQKAIRRAELDVVYTGGYSPHQVMTFAAPLGVGLESNGEYMDIEVNSLLSCQDITDRLNAASVYGIEIVGTKILPDSVGNAMASVAAASYTVRFREGREPNVDIGTVLPDFLAKDSILITKATKKGSRKLDLRPGIYEMNWDGNAFSMLVNASSAGNIKPIQIIEALLAVHGETLQENALLVAREDMYTDISPEENTHQFISLGDIGDDKENGGTDEP